MDFFGTSGTQSSIGKFYFMLIIDDLNRMTWEYFEKFEYFNAMDENETVCKIKSVRFDNGGEFTSKEFGLLQVACHQKVVYYKRDSTT